MARLTFGSNPTLNGFWTYGGIGGGEVDATTFIPVAGEDEAGGTWTANDSETVVWVPNNE
jgi:hypothetical protein